MINYSKPGNTFISNRVRDYVKHIRDDLYLGRLNYLLNGRHYFLGYFTLTKE